MARHKSLNNMLTHALDLAGHGLRVFPLNGKTPIGGHGCLDATSDVLQIESWWERYPKANIGLATGAGIAVLDVDVRRDGGNSLRRLRKGYRFPRTVTAKSGGGGRHYFFGVTKDMWVPNSKDRIGRGLELLYDGRYVVAPPSLHPITGKAYEWLRGPDDECAPLPEWLAELNAKGVSEQSWDKFVEEIKEGEGRNNHLTAYAGYLRRGGATVAEIYDALEARNIHRCRPPLSVKELRTIAKSVGRYKPQDVMVTAPKDDQGNGQRLASMVKGRALFVPGLGWHTWSGRRWRHDDESLQVLHMSSHLGEEIRQAARDNGGNEQAEKLYKWGQVSGMIPRWRAAMAAASGSTDIRVSVDQLDQGPLRVNVINGTYNLQEARLEEHAPGDHFTRMARVEYLPDAECPRWERFLEDILPDPDVRQYIQRAVGYSLTGDTSEQCFFLLYGVGSNGKSTFVETIGHLLGNYSWKISSSAIMGTEHGGGATPELVSLRGPRFVVASESGHKSHLNEPLIKGLTGRDTMPARALYKSPIQFVPQFKLWIHSNYKPVIRGMDYGMWRRIRLIPFEAVITKPDKLLYDRLRVEYPGIFNWALRGFVEWEKYGLREPASIRDEVRGYHEEMDTVQQFVVEKCEVGKDHIESAEELWEAFSRWQQDIPKAEWVYRRDFITRLTGLKFGRVRARIRGSKNQLYCHKGLRLEQSI